MSMIMFINVHPRNNKTASLCTMLPFRSIQRVQEKSIFLDVFHFMASFILDYCVPLDIKTESRLSTTKEHIKSITVQAAF